MKISMQCNVCYKIHSVDLRQIEENFVCDACDHVGQALDDIEIEAVEKQLLLSGKMGIVAVVFTFATIVSLGLYVQAYDHDPRSGGAHETLFWIFLICALLTFVSGLVGSLNNRRLCF